MSHDLQMGSKETKEKDSKWKCSCAPFSHSEGEIIVEGLKRQIKWEEEHMEYHRMESKHGDDSVEWPKDYKLTMVKKLLTNLGHLPGTQ